jgi:hypothetical protein
MKSSAYVADFDSATAMLRALAQCLDQRDFPLLGSMPRQLLPWMKWVASAVNALPAHLREQIYIWGGRFEAVNPKQLRMIDIEHISQWITALYPERQYAAAAIGSSNGAATHLWAALGIPWLPQTFLVPVARSGSHPDEPLADAEWAAEPARRLLEADPDIQLHHMNDPVQDRLMIQRMSYFRIKRRRLGQAYENFLARVLQPEATIFELDCRLRWPTTQYGPRHYFQFGALGGATVDEYHHGGERVRDYLARYQSPVRQWHPPVPNARSPEAEWGFEPALDEDLRAFAQRHRFKVCRISFQEPEQMSPFVADLYRWWNEKRNISDARLLVESFILMEPYWTIHTGSIPFWMVFNKEPSAAALEQYLASQPSLLEIYLMLFSHGVDSIGLVPIEGWRRILAQATERAAFLGVDPAAYPRDFGVFVRYNPDLQQKIHARYPTPSPLSLQEFEEFANQAKARHPIAFDSQQHS